MKPMPTACVPWVVFLAACGGHQIEDVERYVAELEAESGPVLEASPEFAPPAPTTYQAGARRSPFDPPALAANSGAQQGRGGIAPDFSRPRQPLEAFPVSDLGLVGTIGKGAVRRALVVDSDGGVHELRAGDHLGQNHGRIRQIGEAAIQFVEILPDGGGAWVERNRKLTLVETVPPMAGAVEVTAKAAPLVARAAP